MDWIPLRTRPGFKDVDTEGGAIWEKRIHYWKSWRDPAVMGILQVDVSDVMLPNAFPVSPAKPCRLESGKSLLQEKDYWLTTLANEKFYK